MKISSEESSLAWIEKHQHSISRQNILLSDSISAGHKHANAEPQKARTYKPYSRIENGLGLEMIRLIGEGAEAQVYCTRMYGQEVIVKVRAPKRYRIPELDSAIRTARTRKEARIMFKAVEAGANAPRIVGLGSNEIYMEKIPGRLLKDVKAQMASMEKSGEQLGRLHNAGIAHGDFTPANLMISGNKVYVIDFGLSEATGSSEERALDLLLMKRQVSSMHYSIFISGYSKVASESRATLRRLEEVEERGRYQVRTLA